MNNKAKNLLMGKGEMAESLLLSILLTFSGGFQDAYTYMVRGGVFANGQTGNVVLFSANLFSGNFRAALHYLFPITAFIAGVFVAAAMQYHFTKAKIFHWRQWVLAMEFAVMLGVGFIPVGETGNMAANILVSFSCAMQVEAFRRVCGVNYASTMCIGNLRSGVEALSLYMEGRSKSELKKAFYYFVVILVFILGAGAGAALSKGLGVHSIWCCCLLLLTCFIMLQLDRKKGNNMV